MSSFTLLSPSPDCCQECAVKHDLSEPHNAQSLFYGIRFSQIHGRSPTWADAMTHCPEATKIRWIEYLAELKIDANSTNVSAPSGVTTEQVEQAAQSVFGKGSDSKLIVRQDIEAVIKKYLSGDVTVDGLRDQLYWLAFQNSELWDLKEIEQIADAYRDQINPACIVNPFRQFNQKLQIVLDIQQSLAALLSQWSKAGDGLIEQVTQKITDYIAPLTRGKEDRFKPYLRTCYKQLADKQWRKLDLADFQKMGETIERIRTDPAVREQFRQQYR